MKKLFKLILNTIPRPILIRLSYVARPVLAFALKGTTFTDTKRNAIMCFHQVHFH